jgi:hypothetical protein
LVFQGQAKYPRAKMLSGYLMERASRLIAKLRYSSDAIGPEDLARAAWPVAVGPKIAARARVARMVGKRLVLEVDDPIWQRQLFTLTRHILANIEKHLGPDVVADLEFRVVPARRGPQRAEAAARTAGDDAERISDPVLRNIYKASRRKSLA